MVQKVWLADFLKKVLSKNTSFKSDSLVVFSADTDQTQSYVFESNVLPEIRGASRQIAELSSRAQIEVYLAEMNLDPGDCLVFAGGGSVLALLPNVKAARDLETKLAEAYAASTQVVTMSCTHLEVNTKQLADASAPTYKGYAPSVKWSFFGLTDDENEAPRSHQSFGHVVSLLAFHLRHQKLQRFAVPLPQIAKPRDDTNQPMAPLFIEMMPFAHICESCHVRPASRSITTVETEDLICDVCEQKRRKGRDKDEQGRTHWLKTLQHVFKEAGYDVSRVTYADNIDMLTRDNNRAKLSHEDREQDQAVALIYADGDSIGERLQSFESLETYRSFSQALILATQKAVASAISAIFQERDEETGVCHWEIITIGGDDVLILMHAKDALNFSIHLSQTFTDEMKRLRPDDEEVYMSVGFTVGKTKTPIRLLYEGAKNALKQAKRQAKDEDQKERAACINWHNIIKEGNRSGSEAVQHHTQMSKQHLTTGRPYTIDDATNLQTTVSLFRKAGLNSQFYSLASELEQSPARGSLYYHYQRARLMRDKTRFQLLNEIEQIWDSKDFPWIGHRNNWYTIFPDVLDLL